MVSALAPACLVKTARIIRSFDLLLRMLAAERNDPTPFEPARVTYIDSLVQTGLM
jgi:hypothetical protein